MEITQMRARTKDLSERVNMAFLERANNEGVSLARYLEEEDPTNEYPQDAPERRMTALERAIDMLGEGDDDDPGIRLTHDWEAGDYADQLGAFDRFGERGRILQVEWMLEEYRKVSLRPRGIAAQRSILSSDWATVGSAMRPYVEAAAARVEDIQPAIPINELVATTTPIDSNVYRAIYMSDPDPATYRLLRVGELGEIPGSKLTAGSRAIDLFKYARRLDVSYEVLRRVPIPLVAIFIARLAVQAEVDKSTVIQNVLINGDGNAGTAATVVPLVDVDSTAAANTLTLKAHLGFKLKFRNPYIWTTELVREDVLLQQLLLNTGSANIPLAMAPQFGFGGFTPMNDRLGDNVRYGISDTAPANKILAFDRRSAIERVTEIGSNINETQRFVKNQTETMTFSEVEGYAVFDAKATKILDLTDVTP